MEPASSVETFVALVGVVCFTISIILFLSLVGEAFNKDKGPKGFVLGLLALLYPIGTYKYCQHQWETDGPRFKKITFLLIIGMISMIVCKIL